MSNALKCDRCGKFYEEEPENDRDIYIKRLENHHYFGKDLCSDCQRQLQMWFDRDVTYIVKVTPKTYAKLFGGENPETVTPESIVKEAEAELLYSGRRINTIVNEVIDKALKWARTTSVDEIDRVMRERGLEESK